LDVIDRLADGLNLFGLLVGDRQLKFVLELHDQLDGVEAVGVEVVDEVRFARDLALVNAHLLADDLDYLLLNVFHIAFPTQAFDTRTTRSGSLALYRSLSLLQQT